MTIFDVEVHSSELELLKDAADEYDWERIESEVEPIFKEAARDFRNRKRSFVCPHKKDEEEKDLQETFPFLHFVQGHVLDEIEQDEAIASRNPISRNPKCAGRPQPRMRGKEDRISSPTSNLSN